MTSVEVERLFNDIDVTRKGNVDYNEFLAAALAGKRTVDEPSLRVAFAMLDCDCDGVITKSDLMRTMGKAGSEAAVDEMFSQLHCTSGRLYFGDFLRMMAHGRGAMALTRSSRSVLPDGAQTARGPTVLRAQSALLDGTLEKPRACSDCCRESCADIRCSSAGCSSGNAGGDGGIACRSSAWSPACTPAAATHTPHATHAATPSSAASTPHGAATTLPHRDCTGRYDAAAIAREEAAYAAAAPALEAAFSSLTRRTSSCASFSSAISTLSFSTASADTAAPYRAVPALDTLNTLSTSRLMQGLDPTATDPPPLAAARKASAWPQEGPEEALHMPRWPARGATRSCASPRGALQPSWRGSTACNADL
mmetsp:Transcript_17726/g.39685  ORF Transcript_17726/g.39685 Transcript_17726/m.39685 type:complete len:366 (-) Transcript_17726:1398-2495(-)